MAETKHKKRGSALTLGFLLVVLIAVTAYLIISLPATEAEAAEGSVAALVQDQPDDVAKTTLIHAGDVAPDFTVEMLDGSKVTLSELQGKPTLLIFWATWCPPCRQEMAHLQEGVIDHFAGKNLVVLPISRGEKRDVVEKFLADNGYTFGVGLDPERAIYDLYASNFVPRTFIINKRGKVVYRVAGYDEETAKAVNAAIAKALR